MSDKNRDIEFLYEIGCMRFINRSWQRFLGPNVANLSEHIFRVTWISIILAKREKVQDLEKILKMALVHDIVESRTADSDYISRQYLEMNEKQAIEDILNETSLEKDFLETLEEYEERKCIEAKIVKDADNLDVDMELRENEYHSFPKWHIEKRKDVIRDELFTESAKCLWDEICISNPHDWHQEGRNRFNKGDWSKKDK